MVPDGFERVGERGPVWLWIPGVAQTWENLYPLAEAVPGGQHLLWKQLEPRPSMDTAADFLMEVIREREVAHVVGISLGGVLAQLLLDRLPSADLQFHLVNSWWHTDAGLRITFHRWQRWFRCLPQEEVLWLLYHSAHTDRQWQALAPDPGFLRRLREIHLDVGLVLAQILAALHHEGGKGIPASPVPRVQVLYGTEDRIVPSEHAWKLAARFSGEPVALEGFGHRLAVGDGTRVLAGHLATECTCGERP